MHYLTSAQSSFPSTDEHNEEVRELRQNLATITTQCSQLNEANQAWQLYQQTQLHQFINQLQDYLLFDPNISFDQLPQLILDQIIKERQHFNEQYQELQQENDDLKSGNIFTYVKKHY